MSHATKSAVMRFARVIGYAAAAGATAAGINFLNIGGLDGTQLAGFVSILTAGLVALDKYVRASQGGE